jgi:hypothetical protein
MADEENEDTAFNGLGKLLTPILWVERAIVWWHNRTHPNDPPETL